MGAQLQEAETTPEVHATEQCVLPHVSPNARYAVQGSASTEDVSISSLQAACRKIPQLLHVTTQTAIKGYNMQEDARCQERVGHCSQAARQPSLSDQTSDNI